MKIKITKSILLKELAIANKFRGKEGKNDTGIPYIELSATADSLKIRATDNQVFYTTSLPLQIIGEEDLETVHEVIEEGVVALTPKFEEVIRRVSSKEVNVTVEGEHIIITAEGVNAKVATTANKFQETPTGTEGPAIDSPKSFYDSFTNKTAFASSDSNSRPALKGLNIKGDGKIFRVEATNSHRLARYEQEQDIEFSEITIPAKKFASVLEVFNDDDKIKLIPLGNYVKLIQEEKEVFIRLLDGKYPDTSGLVNIPESSCRLNVNAKEFVSAIDSAIPFAKDDKGTLIVQLEISNEGIKIFSVAEDGSIMSNVPVLERKGDFEGKVAVNAKYTIEAIKAHNTEIVTFVIESAAKPLYIQSSEKGNTQLIMPIRH